MKILLLNPPQSIKQKANPQAWLHNLGVYPPLGLLYLAAYLEKFSDHEVEIVDAFALQLSGSKLKKYLAARKYDLVGITCLTFNLSEVIECIKIVKEITPGVPVVLGGPHPTIYPRESVNLPGVDFVIVGQGVQVFKELADAIEQKRDQMIPGVVARAGAVSRESYEYQSMDLDSVPFPARHLIPQDRYYSIVTRKKPMTCMVTSLGCPYQCIFCSRPPMEKILKSSPPRVVEEVEMCARMGFREIMFWDEIFTLTRDRVLEITDGFLKRGIKIDWDIRTRVDLVDRELLRQMRKAGCIRIQYGIESGSDRVLGILQKGFTVERVRNAVRMTRAEGITVSAGFMIGSPGETREDIIKTIAFACELDVDYAQFSITTPIPFTELYRWAVEKGLFPDYARKYARNPTGEFIPLFWEEKINSRELLKLRDLAYRKFFFRPRYIIKNLLKLRSGLEAKIKIGTGLGLLKEFFRRQKS